MQERWYRFQGEAGERLADNSGPPSWEECGTSRVGWLAGTHPQIRYRGTATTQLGGVCQCATSRVGWLARTHPQIRYIGTATTQLGGVWYQQGGLAGGKTPTDQVQRYRHYPARRSGVPAGWAGWLWREVGNTPTDQVQRLRHYLNS